MHKKAILTLVIFGIVLRLFVVALYQHITIISDSEGYIELAELLLSFNLNGYDGSRSPGYPILLLFDSLKITILLQCILGIATSVIVYKNLLLLKFNPKNAFYTALFLSSFINVIFYDLAILTENVTLFIFTLIVYIYLKEYEQTPSTKAIIYLNILFSFLILIKPFYFFIPFIFYGFSALRNFSFKNIFNKSILILIGPIISFLGWSYVNKINTGYFVPTTFYGINLSQNCVYFVEKSPEKYYLIRDIYIKHRELSIRENKDVSMSIWSAYDELLSTTGLSFIDLSYELNEFSKATIKQNPSDYLKHVVLNSWMDFWKTAIYWNYDAFKVPYVNKIFLVIWYLQNTILLIFKYAFVLLFPMQLYNFFRSRKITVELVLASVIMVTALAQALVTYGTNARYSYPFEFLIIILVISFISRLKDRKN